MDNCATTQIDSMVLETMMPYLTKNYANANSTHKFGLEAHNGVQLARNQVSELIGAEANEIIFTSGATEAINIAIKGIVEKNVSKGKHIITSCTEHSAVLDTCRFLESKGFEITYLPVKVDGLINLQDLKDSLRNDTIVVCIMYANNETGVLQPIKEIADLAHNAGAFIMSDCTQAIGKIPISVDELGIDLMSISGHKIYAPKGVGALYVRQRNGRIKLPALLHGGGHEKGVRSGTLNVPGIVALGAACVLAKNEMQRNARGILSLRDSLETELLRIEGTTVNGNKKMRLYNVSNIRFDGADSDAIIIRLSNPDSNLPPIAVSNGSACTSKTIEPSHVLSAMGLDETAAFNCIRFSLGKFNTQDEIPIVVDAVKNVVEKLRAMVV